MMAIIQVKAQGTAGIDVIPNGGFEKWQDTGQPTGWRIVSSLNPERVQERRPESTGVYALKIWLNGSIKSREKILSIRTVKDEWRRVESTVTIPENIHSMGMGIRTQSYQGYMLFDDMSMVLKESGPDISPVPEAPDNLRMKAYQNEMEISWNKVADETIKWEVVFDDQVETITSGNSYVKTKLKPGSTHHIKVRAVKGKEFSPYAERRGATERMCEAENSEDRIPYLRTILPDGSCEGRFLKLYYNELANPNAKVSYKLDGVTIEPKDNTLEFPEFEGFYKRFRLEVYIDEGEGREWEILYPHLGVKRNEK